MQIQENLNYKSKKIIKKWWESRRLKYNIGIIISAISEAILSVIIATIAKNDWEPFGFIFWIAGFSLMIGLANIFYNLGYLMDIKYNKNNSENFRQRLFNLGFWGSVSIPYVFPLIIIVISFILEK